MKIVKLYINLVYKHLFLISFYSLLFLFTITEINFKDKFCYLKVDTSMLSADIFDSLGRSLSSKPT